MFKKTSHTVQAHTGLAVFQLQFLGICNSKKNIAKSQQQLPGAT